MSLSRQRPLEVFAPRNTFVFETRNIIVIAKYISEQLQTYKRICLFDIIMSCLSFYKQALKSKCKHTECISMATNTDSVKHLL